MYSTICTRLLRSAFKFLDVTQGPAKVSQGSDEHAGITFKHILLV